MFITGGIANSLCIKGPKKNTIIKPTKSKLRQSLFNFLGTKIINTTFIDLFSGTGLYGLESISRGASSGLFIDNSIQSIHLIKDNLKKVMKCCKINNNCFSLIKANAFNYQKYINIYQHYNFVFIDPPFFFYEKKILKICNLIHSLIQQIKNTQITFIFEIPFSINFQFNNLNLKHIKTLGNGPFLKIFIYVP